MFSSVKMLVATDDPAALKSALEVLFSFDIDPRTTSDPRTAAGWLDAERFDAALVDAGMPATGDWPPAVRQRRSTPNRESPLFQVAGAETFNKRPGGMIDFILSSPAMTKRYVPKSYRIIPGSVGASGSDHNPVLARFDLTLSD